jgi:amidase
LAGCIDLGRSASAVSALEQQKIWLRRRAFSGQVAALLQRFDLPRMPVECMASPTQVPMDRLGVDPEGFARLVKFSAAFNLTGSPTIALPGGFTPRGMPVAIQLVCAFLNEALLLRVGRAFERATDWHRKHPALRA